MNLMAGRAKLLAMAVLLAMIAFGCSNEGDDETLELEPAESSTTSTTQAATTSTIATTTTFSEQARAEADVVQLVTDFWLTEIDTSTGEIGLEFMTGLVEARTREWTNGLTDAGQILRDFEGQKRIEVRQLQIDVDEGTGEVEVCIGSGSEVLDLRTLEQIDIGSDPEFLSTSRFLVLETHEGWKISEVFATAATGPPELCEIGAS